MKIMFFSPSARINIKWWIKVIVSFVSLVFKFSDQKTKKTKFVHVAGKTNGTQRLSWKAYIHWLFWCILSSWTKCMLGFSVLSLHKLERTSARPCSTFQVGNGFGQFHTTSHGNVTNHMQSSVFSMKYIFSFILVLTTYILIFYFSAARPVAPTFFKLNTVDPKIPLAGAICERFGR